MSDYWDASAVVEALQEPNVRARLCATGGVTRPHTLAEVFSTLTGGRLGFRCQPDDASQLIAEAAMELDFVELTKEDTLQALACCKKRGVRGGLVHDFLHAAAAEKAGAKTLLTLNRSDFQSLGSAIPVELP